MIITIIQETYIASSEKNYKQVLFQTFDICGAFWKGALLVRVRNYYKRKFPTTDADQRSLYYPDVSIVIYIVLLYITGKEHRVCNKKEGIQRKYAVNF